MCCYRAHRPLRLRLRSPGPGSGSPAPRAAHTGYPPARSAPQNSVQTSAQAAAGAGACAAHARARSARVCPWSCLWRLGPAEREGIARLPAGGHRGQSLGQRVPGAPAQQQRRHVSGRASGRVGAASCCGRGGGICGGVGGWCVEGKRRLHVQQRGLELSLRGHGRQQAVVERARVAARLAGRHVVRPAEGRVRRLWRETLASATALAHRRARTRNRMRARRSACATTTRTRVTKRAKSRMVSVETDAGGSGWRVAPPRSARAASISPCSASSQSYSASASARSASTPEDGASAAAEAAPRASHGAAASAARGISTSMAPRAGACALGSAWMRAAAAGEWQASPACAAHHTSRARSRAPPLLR
jgi:hypothetical protein